MLDRHELIRREHPIRQKKDDRPIHRSHQTCTDLVKCDPTVRKFELTATRRLYNDAIAGKLQSCIDVGNLGKEIHLLDSKYRQTSNTCQEAAKNSGASNGFLASVAASAGSWIDVNSVGGSSFQRNNLIAGLGQAIGFDSYGYSAMR